MGTFWFSNPDCNLIVVTMDEPRLSGKPMSLTHVDGNKGSVQKKKKMKLHCSVMNGGQKFWDMYNVYVDDLVNEEHIMLVVSHDIV